MYHNGHNTSFVYVYTASMATLASACTVASRSDYPCEPYELSAYQNHVMVLMVLMVLAPARKDLNR